MLLDFIIAAFIFFSVYSLIYQFYLDRTMRVSLAAPGEPNPGSSGGKRAAARENPIRKILKSFNFLANFKIVRSLASRSIPAKLIMAGSPLSIIEFVIFKILSIFVFLILGGITFSSQQIVYIGLSAIVGFIVPDIWLNLKIKRRHLEIRRDLPQVIDLLNLCVSAGLDFMLSVQRVTLDFKKCALTDELTEMWRETRMGAPRRETLKNLSRRVNMPELSSFTRTLLQADRMGSPIGEALKIQAEEIRLRRYFKGEEAAFKAPIKLLFPLFCFILPAVLVIVAGPILIQFMKGGIKF